ncbi:MAG: HAMP domain-containing histidine kinase [Clostridiales Family XIII bacterium]|jgi:signal transduction histidine kinase|nr:HAMP domain-containing histidine kinase [Clostridiales Family XIII bacterium]
MFFRIARALRGGASEPSLKKLRRKLLIVNIIGLTLVIVGSFCMIYIASYNRVQNEIDKALFSIPPGVLENVMLSQRGDGTAVASGPPGNNDLTVSGNPFIPIDYSKSFVANIERDGRITVFSLLELSNEDYAGAIEDALAGRELTGDIEKAVPSDPDAAADRMHTGAVTIAGRAWKYSLEFAGAGANPVQGQLRANEYSSIVFLDIEDANRRLRELALILVASGIVAIAVILLLSVLVINRAIRPVEESMARQRRFVADASHELKTPIAVIAANAEAAKDAEAPACWIDNIADEASRMSGLVDNLLALAKSEEKKAEKTAFDLVGVVCEEADRIEAFLFEKNVVFDFDLRAPQGKPLIVRSDREKLRTVLSILLENAVKYTPPGGRVAIQAGVGEDGAFVAVSNTGAYILPEMLTRIFDRFYRADPSRSSETGGHGIGLSIAKTLAETLGGGLAATSNLRVIDNQCATPDLQIKGAAINTFTFLFPGYRDGK